MSANDTKSAMAKCVRNAYLQLENVERGMETIGFPPPPWIAAFLRSHKLHLLFEEEIAKAFGPLEEFLNWADYNHPCLAVKPRKHENILFKGATGVDDVLWNPPVGDLMDDAHHRAFGRWKSFEMDLHSAIRSLKACENAVRQIVDVRHVGHPPAVSQVRPLNIRKAITRAANMAAEKTLAPIHPALRLSKMNPDSTVTDSLVLAFTRERVNRTTNSETFKYLARLDIETARATPDKAPWLRESAAVQHNARRVHDESIKPEEIASRARALERRYRRAIQKAKRQTPKK